MSLKRLGIARGIANTEVLLTDVNIPYFTSVIAANLSEEQTANVTVTIRPNNTNDEEEFAYVTYNFPIKPFNTLETNRFALNANDSLYVKSSIDGVSFVAEGIPQPDLIFRYSVGNSVQFPVSPVVGDQYFNTTTNELNVYTTTGWRVLAWAEEDES